MRACGVVVSHALDINTKRWGYIANTTMNEEIKTRKKNRLYNYDYGRTGIYFLTLCTKERRNYFWGDLTKETMHIGDIELSEYGKIVDETIRRISKIYPALSVRHYVIMPDHVHLLLRIHPDEYGRPMVAPTVSRVVQQFKGVVTKQIGRSIWQKLYYDHVIRNQKDYDEHKAYIYNNPRTWYVKQMKSTCK